MATLTAKQEAFCLVYMECGNASEAYRRAYDTANISIASVNRQAKAVMDNPKIASRLEELRAPIRERAGLTLESHLKRLNELSMQAEASEQFGAAITAETNRGKASGLYVERVEQSGPGGGPVENKWTIEIVKPGEK